MTDTERFRDVRDRSVPRRLVLISERTPDKLDGEELHTMTIPNEFPLALKLPFTEYVVPARCRTFRPVDFSETTNVMVREHALNAAEIAYRVRPTLDALGSPAFSSYEILSFDARFWWPAIWNGRKVRKGDLIDSAAGASSFAAVSIVPSTSLDGVDFPKQAKIKVLKHGESDWTRQVANADHGVGDVAFFDEFLHLAAGAPVFHAIEAGGGFDMQVGTSEWARLRPVQVLPGPRPSQSIRSARAGRIFGLDEIEKQCRLLCDQGYGIYRRVEIEVVSTSDRSDAAAARLSARGVIDSVWIPASNCLAPEARHVALPSLFDHKGVRVGVGSLPDDEAMYDALKQIVGIAGQTTSPALKACIGPAESVMRRLGEIIDGDAISNFG